MGNAPRKTFYTNITSSKPDVIPYREGMNAPTESILKQFLKSGSIMTKSNSRSPSRAQPTPMQTSGPVRDRSAERERSSRGPSTRDSGDTQRYFDLAYYERRFNQNELEKLRLDFQVFSKEGKFAKKKILEYFGLVQLEDTAMANRFFESLKTVAKKPTESTLAMGFLDYDKFMRAMGVLLRGDPTERLDFIYSFFDINKEGFVYAEDMFEIMYEFYSTLIELEFEHSVLNQLKLSLTGLDLKEMKQLINQIVQDIYMNYSSSKDKMTYSEWKGWFLNQPGLLDVLNFKVESFEK